MKDNLSIGMRIALGFVTGLVLLLVIGSVAYVNTYRLIEEMRWVTHTHEVIERINAVLSGLKDQETGIRGYVLTGDEVFLEPFRAGEAAVRPALEKVADLTSDNPEQQARVRDLQLEIARQAELWRSLLGERDGKGFEAAQTTIKSGASKRGMDRLRGIANSMSEEELRLLRQRGDAARQMAANTTGTIVWGTLLAALLLLVLAVAITRSITGPLRALTEGAAHLGGGNLSYRIGLKGRDETGVLAAAMNQMAENLGKTMVTAESERQGRSRVEGLLATISDTANNLVSATSEILAATTQQAAGAQEQAAAVAQTVTTVNEVVQTSEQAADRARLVADTAQRSLDVSKTGKRVIDDSVQAMSMVKEQVEASTESIVSLAEQAQSIGVIISSVSEIAEQTNLLALNAAIEASRAGEHGRGFSVVAAEIKALAGQSKKATTQVRQILGEIQRATNGAVMSTEECSKGVNGAVKIILQAGDTIRSLADVINQAAQAATQIAASAGQQAAGTSQIHQAMQNINQVTNQNLGSTRQMEQAARDLNLLGGRLRERLAGYEQRGAVGQS
jgi:methyl-accepting chemotaxis protein